MRCPQGVLTSIWLSSPFKHVDGPTFFPVGYKQRAKYDVIRRFLAFNDEERLRWTPG